MLFHLPNTLLQKIASEPRTLSSPTRTDLALQMANELFTISKGDRSDKPNVLLVLTDGRPKLPRDEDFDYGILDNINEQLKVLTAWQWRIQGMDPGSRGAMVPLLFLDKNEARRAEKMLGGPPPSPPPQKKFWMTGPPPYLKVWIQHCLMLCFGRVECFKSLYWRRNLVEFDLIRKDVQYILLSTVAFP